MSPTTKAMVRYGLLIVTAAILQRGLFSQIRIEGAVADVLLVLAVAAGLVGGTERGAAVGFCSGLALDLMLTTPFGLAAISYLVAGVVAGWAERTIVRSARWLTMVIAAVSALIGVAVFDLLGTLLGRSDLLHGELLAVGVVVAVSTALLVLPAMRMCRWADQDLDHLRPVSR
jgi:rod shape-determining protein MreD